MVWDRWVNLLVVPSKQAEGVVRNFLNEPKDTMEGPSFFNEDDAMTYYFHRSHYTDINIGQWNKPYALAA